VTPSEREKAHRLADQIRAGAAVTLEPDRLGMVGMRGVAELLAGEVAELVIELTSLRAAAATEAALQSPDLPKHLMPDLAKFGATIKRQAADLAIAHSELLRAFHPTEDDKHVLRWLRENLLEADELVRGDVRYMAALDLLQRLLAVKVKHVG
jgi:hypothetical protein